MNRTDVIRERLFSHLESVASVPIVQAPEVWNPTADTLHAPFGYARPFLDRALGLSYVLFCPELIARTTAHLSDQDLGDYMTCVEHQLDHYLANCTMTDEEASAWFDKYLSSTFIGSMTLMNAVQMGWLGRERTT